MESGCGRLLRAWRSCRHGGEAAELAEFYGVPVAELLPDARATRRGSPSPKLVIDLQRLAELPTHQAGPLARYAAAIDPNAATTTASMTIRSEDLRSLAVIYDMTAEDLTDQLMHWGVLRGTELD